MALPLLNILRRPHGFRGGLFLPRFDRRALPTPVQPLALPSSLLVLMRQHEGPPSTVCVEPGQLVRAGQRIGQGELPGSLHAHSPVSGRVVRLTRADSARLADVPAVELAPDERTEQWVVAEQRGSMTGREGSVPSLDQLIDAAEQAGLTDFQPRPRSLAGLLRAAREAKVRHVIVNTLAGEPILFMPALAGDAELSTIVDVGCAIVRGLRADWAWLAADRADSQALARMRKVARDAPMRVTDLANKYPQHMPVLLAAAVTGIETPPGRTPLDIGVLVLEWQAVLGLAAASKSPGGEPKAMTHRDISVSGPAVLRPGCYRVPLGTSFEHVLRQVGLQATVRRVIEGGPITGQAVSHLQVVVTKQTSALIVLGHEGDRVPSPGPCIRCGWCQEDCPVGIDPRALLDLAEREEWAAGRRLRPEACLECGLCSHVCPAELPLAQGVAQVRRMCESEMVNQ